jgi:hypothetical protein
MNPGRGSFNYTAEHALIALPIPTGYFAGLRLGYEIWNFRKNTTVVIKCCVTVVTEVIENRVVG